MGFVWFLLGGLVGGLVGSVGSASVTSRALLLPIARDRSLAEAYARALGINNDPEKLANYYRMLNYVRQWGQGVTLPPPPGAAAGALWHHHGYYDPMWPGRVYPYGYFGEGY
jgi:hypothetical protein